MMMNSLLAGGLAGLPFLVHGKSRAVTAENPTGGKGVGGQAASVLGPARKGSPCLRNVESGTTATLMDVEGCGVIGHIWMTVTDKTSPENNCVLRDLVLRMYWDGEETPSVEAPLGDFFCCGFGESYTVNSMPFAVNPKRGFNCYFPMPFARRAKITVENQHPAPIPDLFYQIDYTLYDSLPETAAYFHAQWRRQPITQKGQDYVVLDGVDGRGWYAGTFLALATLERGWWGEGEVKFFLDGDEAFPTICGTGAEDYFGGAWSFGGTDATGKMCEQTYQTPFLGYPFYAAHCHTNDSPYWNDDCPPMRALYRFHLPDPIFFEHDIRVTMQQIGGRWGGNFERQDDVSTVAYWYQSEPHRPFAPLCAAPERRPR